MDERERESPGAVLNRHVTVRVTRDEKTWLESRAAELTHQRPRGAKRVAEADVVRIAIAEMRARIEDGAQPDA